MADAVMNDPLVIAIKEILAVVPFSGSATELLERLNSKVPFEKRPKTWPRVPNQLSGRVRSLATPLRELGIEVELDQRRSSDNNKIIVLSLEGAAGRGEPL